MIDAVKIELGLWEKIGIENAQLYANDIDGFLNLIRNKEPFRVVLHNVYGELLKENKIIPIEKLDEDTKQEIYKRSFEWQPEPLDKRQRAAICRIIWLMTTIFDKYFV